MLRAPPNYRVGANTTRDAPIENPARVWKPRGVPCYRGLLLRFGAELVSVLGASRYPSPFLSAEEKLSTSFGSAEASGIEMRPSLFASSVSNEPLWPAGVAGSGVGAPPRQARQRNQSQRRRRAVLSSFRDLLGFTLKRYSRWRANRAVVVSDQPLSRRRWFPHEVHAGVGMIARRDNRPSGRRSAATRRQSNYKQSLVGRRSGTCSRPGRRMCRRAHGVRRRRCRRRLRAAAARGRQSRVGGRILVPARRSPADIHRVAREVPRPAAGEPGDDLPVRRIRARAGGVRCARAASHARARAAAVDHRDCAADCAVHGGHQDAHAHRRLALEPAVEAGNGFDGADHRGRGGGGDLAARTVAWAWRWCSARRWRPPIRCSPRMCSYAVRTIATPCASRSRGRADSTTARHFRSCC